jgi:hypothetical protein
MVRIANMTIALVIALAYEIVLKLARMTIPSLLDAPPVSGITSVLSLVVGLVIILFLLSFHNEEGSNKNIALVLKIVIGCFVLHFLSRLPMMRNLLGYQALRFVDEIIGFVTAVVLLVLLVLYGRAIPAGERSMKQAAVFLTVMLAIGVLRNAVSLAAYARFVISGATTDFSQPFYTTMVILFFMTHASIIYFLYRYYQLKTFTSRR